MFYFFNSATCCCSSRIYSYDFCRICNLDGIFSVKLGRQAFKSSKHTLMESRRRCSATLWLDRRTSAPECKSSRPNDLIQTKSGNPPFRSHLTWNDQPICFRNCFFQSGAAYPCQSRRAWNLQSMIIHEFQGPRHTTDHWYHWLQRRRLFHRGHVH